jgi:O-antigen/teichoic acid export membrane protein
MLRASLILGTGIGLTGMTVGPYVIGAVFGVRYSEAGHLIGPVLYLLIPWTVGNVISRVYLARDDFFLPIISAFGGAAVLIITMPWFVSATQTSGAILATGAGLGFWALILTLMLAKSGDLDLVQVVFRPALASFLAVGIYLLLNSISAWLALPASLFALIGGILIFGIITPNERSYLRSHVFRRP